MADTGPHCPGAIRIEAKADPAKRQRGNRQGNSDCGNPIASTIPDPATPGAMHRTAPRRINDPCRRQRLRHREDTPLDPRHRINSNLVWSSTSTGQRYRSSPRRMHGRGGGPC